MKTKALSLLLSVLLIVSITACGIPASGKAGPCDANGHKWLENTPNYQQPKTCEICGATEGEPLEAEIKDLEFVKADTVNDMKMIIENDPEKTSIAKVWFDNYKIFDSDEKHEAKDGYEWRSVDLHIAIGDDREYPEGSCDEANVIGEYYQDADWDDNKVTVNYYGKDYVCEHVFTVLNEERDVTRPDYKKYGWSGDHTYTFEYNSAFLVPKGFDGMYVGFYDRSEFNLKGQNFDAIENQVNFRLD